MAIQGNLYHYIGAFVPPHQIKHCQASVYFHDTKKVKRETIKENNASQHLSQSALIDFGTVVTKINLYAQPLQSLCE